MNLLLIGCGNIGLSLLNVWSHQNQFNEIVVVQPSLSQAANFKNNTNIQFVDNIDHIPSQFKEDVVVLAIKPQQIGEVVLSVAKRSGCLLLSCLTGITLSRLSSFFPQHHIIRFMPNVAIKTGMSTNISIANNDVDLQLKNQFERVLAKTGKVFWVKQEENLEHLTPILGSGPAFFFLLASQLYQEAIKQNISQHEAKEMIDQLVVGSASLISFNHYDALIQSVTSKKGITEAALEILKPSLEKSISASIEAALQRQEVLGKS